jgi:hypothetical protein
MEQDKLLPGTYTASQLDEQSQAHTREPSLDTVHPSRLLKKAHGLQLTVLVTLILKNLVYGNSLTRLQAFSL